MVRVDGSQRHVIHILAGLDAGGNESLCRALIERAPEGWRSTVVVLNPARRRLEPEFAALEHTDVLWAPSTERAALVRWWWSVCPTLGADTLLMHGLHLNAVILAIVARRFGVTVLAAKVGNPPALRERWKYQMLLPMLRSLHAPLCACSTAVYERLLDLRVELPHGSRALHNGCDVEGIRRRARNARDRRSSDAPFVVGMVARLDPIKDHETLLRAFALLQARGSTQERELWLIGDGMLREQLESSTERLGITSRVRFLGTRTDVPELLGQMDVFAFSTTADEGFGIAMIEAMSAELPIVASDVLACREVLGGGEAGILVPPNEPRALADRLGELASLASERSTWGNRAFERVRREYGLERCVRRWYAVLGHD